MEYSVPCAHSEFPKIVLKTFFGLGDNNETFTLHRVDLVFRFGQRSNTQGHPERGDNKVTKAEDGVWWTYPYFSCKSKSWLSSLSLGIYKSNK